MASELIKLADGILLEVENSDNHVEQISGGSANQLGELPLAKELEAS